MYAIHWSTKNPPATESLVYVLVDEEKVVHVGSTRFGKDRWSGHEDRISETYMIWGKVPEQYREGIERYVGDCYKPEDRHPAVEPIEVNLPF